MNHHFKLSLVLFVSGVCNIYASDMGAEDIQDPLRQAREEYKEYFVEQNLIYKGLEELEIPGARPLNIDVDLAESVLATCPSEAMNIILGINGRVFSKNKKNILFYGPSGTGKSVLAQAIAINSKASCLFFNVGTISTEYMNSGVQNLNKIFKYAQELKEKLGKPSIIILDELESLTKKHVGTNNHENNILITFWQELDKLSSSQVVVIGTMNDIDDVPKQIINRTRMIKIPLPTQEQREAIVFYHLNEIKKEHNLEYPQWLTATYFAERTNRFSNRDLANVVMDALTPAIIQSKGGTGTVQFDHVSSAINQIKKDCRDEWKRNFKKYFSDPKFISLVTLAISIGHFGVQVLGYWQQQANFNRQMSAEQIAKAGVIGKFATLIAFWGWCKKGWYK